VVQIILKLMAKKLSLSSIIKPDESEYIDASKLDAGLNDAYEPIATGSAMHARPLPVNMYTVDEQSMELPDTPLARTPMRITRRYVPTSKENNSVLTSKERPEFPLFKEEESQVESGIAYPKPLQKTSSFNEIFANKQLSDATIYHDYESEILQDFVPANPAILGLLQKSGMEIPKEIILSKKLASKKSNITSQSFNEDRIKQSPKLYIPESMRKSQNGVKKKITI
jgi:hypothetical protein